MASTVLQACGTMVAVSSLFRTRPFLAAGCFVSINQLESKVTRSYPLNLMQQPTGAGLMLVPAVVLAVVLAIVLAVVLAVVLTVELLDVAASVKANITLLCEAQSDVIFRNMSGARYLDDTYQYIHSFYYEIIMIELCQGAIPIGAEGTL
ncbi:MAG: hypothetical protein FRX49_08581 [Trebouxia sp. A1-2]|nr:MAG: hypothetical protein FRX49_08581 [Trebouxia sp. A1-2]